jgi:hypothetical protein
MKINDTVPVYIAGQVVAQANVKELGEGTATLVVPATLVVMATRTELTVETPSHDDTRSETVITGVERTSAGPAEQSAPVGENVSPDNGETTVESHTDVSNTDVSTTQPNRDAPATDAPVAQTVDNTTSTTVESTTVESNQGGEQ